MVIKPSSRFLINGKKVSEEQQVEKTLKSTDVASFFAFLEKAENDASVKGHDSKKRSKDRNNEAKEIEKIVEDLGLSYYFVLMNDNYKAGDFGPGNFKIDQDLSEFFLFDAKDVSKLLARLGYSSRDIARLNDNANNQNRISLKSLLSFIENNSPVAGNKEVDARFINQFLQNGNFNNTSDIREMFGISEDSDYSLHDIKLLLKQLSSILEKAAKFNGFSEFIDVNSLPDVLNASLKDSGNILSEFVNLDIPETFGYLPKKPSDILTKWENKNNWPNRLVDVDNLSNTLKFRLVESPHAFAELKSFNIQKKVENDKGSFWQASNLSEIRQAEFSQERTDQILQNSENFTKIQINPALKTRLNESGFDMVKDTNLSFLNNDEVDSLQEFDGHKANEAFVRDKAKQFFSDRLDINKNKATNIFSNEKIARVMGNLGQNHFDMNQSMQQNMNFQFAQQNPVSSDVIFPQPFSTTAGVISFLSDSWTPHLASYIQQMLHEATNRIVIQLEPRELGKLVIHLQSKANRIMTKILTEHEEAKSLLERNQDILRQYLEEQGLQLDGFKVDVGADNAQHEHKWREEESIINDAAALRPRSKQTTRSASSSVVRDSENYLIHLYV